ncbi:hypothetical protein VNO78_14648 [Psophocarpus tetragonolobus]|uniref:Uncharacterized protein n=1 Tax=Psophocarpus tetragonolobus TaxID=3891 RepID=A0AAN9SEH0_PSOTE
MSLSFWASGEHRVIVSAGALGTERWTFPSGLPMSTELWSVQEHWVRQGLSVNKLGKWSRGVALEEYTEMTTM